MLSSHSLLSRLSVTHLPKCLSIFLHLNPRFNTNSANFDALPNVHAPTNSVLFGDCRQDWVKTLATLSSNCATVSELSRVHGQILRTIMFEVFSAPFYWNNIIRSYTKLKAPIKAVSVFMSMLRAGILPDSYTLPIALKAICQIYAFGIGRQMHSVAIRLGLESNEYCESGFISVYSKAGEYQNARNMFDQNPDRKLGSWNAIIGGLSQGGCSKEAVDMFIELRQGGFEADDITMVCIMSACGNLGDLSLAQQLHKYVFEARTIEKPDILMSNSLVDMYGKCGRMDLAHRVFSGMAIKNVSSWTSLIVGYATHGQEKEALKCFWCMREAGVEPNHVTFVGVLSACVHGGMVREGKFYFDMMTKFYRIMPQLSHYGCMVDLLGRAGLFEEAREMVEEMPMNPNSAIWGCLMGACEKYGNVTIGEWVAKHLQELEPWNDGVYVVLSNIYADRGLWREVEKVREVMKQRRLIKIPGYSLGTSYA